MIFRILEDQLAQKSKESKEVDRRFMQLALTLGRRGQGRTWPNPAVGAVVVKDGVIIGRGWTQPGGRPHAEPVALARAGEAARGATLYVTLEPCSHFGRSPPCADAVIAAGIARVVSAVEDPNPEVAGQGHAKLRAAGITVDIGLGADEAARDHAGHFRRVRDKRPHVILKLAVSSDDKIGAAGRKPFAITGEAAKARVRDTELQVWQNVEQSYLNLGEAEERIGAAQKAVESAEENYQLARGRFDAGVANIIELTDAQLALTQAQSDQAQALSDYRIGIARLERALGRR